MASSTKFDSQAVGTRSVDHWSFVTCGWWSASASNLHVAFHESTPLRRGIIALPILLWEPAERAFWQVLINNAAQTLTRREGWNIRMAKLETQAAGGLPTAFVKLPAEVDGKVVGDMSRGITVAFCIPRLLT